MAFRPLFACSGASPVEPGGSGAWGTAISAPFRLLLPATVGNANGQYKQENRSHFSDFKRQTMEGTQQRSRGDDRKVYHTLRWTHLILFLIKLFQWDCLLFYAFKWKKDLDLTIKFMQIDPRGNTSIENITKVQRHWINNANIVRVSRVILRIQQLSNPPATSVLSFWL